MGHAEASEDSPETKRFEHVYSGRFDSSPVQSAHSMHKSSLILKSSACCFPA
jgi:hypothetical protein